MALDQRYLSRATLSTYCANAWINSRLNGQPWVQRPTQWFLGVHTANPGETGTNAEVTTSVQRVPVTWTDSITGLSQGQQWPTGQFQQADPGPPPTSGPIDQNSTYTGDPSTALRTNDGSGSMLTVASSSNAVPAYAFYDLDAAPAGKTLADANLYIVARRSPGATQNFAEIHFSVYDGNDLNNSRDFGIDNPNTVFPINGDFIGIVVPIIFTSDQTVPLPPSVGSVQTVGSSLDVTEFRVFYGELSLNPENRPGHVTYNSAAIQVPQPADTTTVPPTAGTQTPFTSSQIITWVSVWDSNSPTANFLGRAKLLDNQTGDDTPLSVPANGSLIIPQGKIAFVADVGHAATDITVRPDSATFSVTGADPASVHTGNGTVTYTSGVTDLRSLDGDTTHGHYVLTGTDGYLGPDLLLDALPAGSRADDEYEITLQYRVTSNGGGSDITVYVFDRDASNPNNSKGVTSAVFSGAVTPDYQTVTLSTAGRTAIDGSVYPRLLQFSIEDGGPMTADVSFVGIVRKGAVVTDYSKPGLALTDAEEIALLREVFLGTDPGIYSQPTIILDTADEAEQNNPGTGLTISGPAGTGITFDSPTNGTTKNTLSITGNNLSGQSQTYISAQIIVQIAQAGVPNPYSIMHINLIPEIVVPLGSGLYFPPGSITVSIT